MIVEQAGGVGDDEVWYGHAYGNFQYPAKSRMESAAWPFAVPRNSCKTIYNLK
jgi:hypothetical protein